MTIDQDMHAGATDDPRSLGARASAAWAGARRHKLAGLAIALVIEALLVLLLLTLGARIAGEAEDEKVFTEFTAQDFSQQSEPETEAPAEAQPEDAAVPPEPQPENQRPTPLDLPEPERPKPPLVSNPVPAPPPPPAPPAPPQPQPRDAPKIAAKINPSRTYGPADSGPPRTSTDSEQVGTAPNGEPLYAARWYREPTDSELAGYLSTATGPGYALIACKTVAGYYVEDCELLSEGPAGSMMGRAVLAAAWQFRVRPARIGGREQFGSWVRIRIDYTRRPPPR